MKALRWRYCTQGHGDYPVVDCETCLGAIKHNYREAGADRMRLRAAAQDASNLLARATESAELNKALDMLTAALRETA